MSHVSEADDFFVEDEDIDDVMSFFRAAPKRQTARPAAVVVDQRPHHVTFIDSHVVADPEPHGIDVPETSTATIENSQFVTTAG